MSNSFFQAVEARRSIYKLQNTCPISDERIEEIVSRAVKYTPGAFNVQSARAVILLRKDHERLWDMGDALVKRSVPEAAYNALKAKMAGLRAAYGSVSLVRGRLLPSLR